MNTWIIADTHWNHKDIIQFENRPKDFNKIICKNWQKRVAKNDLVIHLGDVIFSRASELQKILEKLPGRKILTRGNHDRRLVEWYLNKGFDFVCDEFRIDNIIFSHEPIKINDPFINIHGHLHSQTHRDYLKDYPFYSNRNKLVSIEKTLAPVLLKEFI